MSQRIFKMSLAWILTGRRLCHWSPASSVMLGSTSAHTSSRHCFKSLTFCTFVWQTLLNYALDFVVNLNEVMAVRWPLCPRFCSQLEWGHGCSVATNLPWALTALSAQIGYIMPWLFQIMFRGQTQTEFSTKIISSTRWMLHQRSLSANHLASTDK